MAARHLPTEQEHRLLNFDDLVIEWLCNFNGMSIRHGLFNVYKLENHVHCTIISIFLCGKEIFVGLYSLIIISSFLISYKLAHSAGAVEYTDCISAEGSDPPKECPRYDIKQSDGCGSSNAEALVNAEYPFIAITPRSTLARSGSNW